MRLFAAVGLLLVAVALHFWATFTGVYEAQMLQGFVWFDNVLHAMVGAAFVLVWLTMVERLWPNASFFARAASALLFVVAMATLWELFELGFYVFFKTHALGLKVYPQTLAESIWDSLSNVGGAALLLMALLVRARPIEAVKE